MIRRVVLRPQAEADLDDIWTYSAAAWSGPQAISYLTGLDAVLQLLAEFPEMARLRPEFMPPVRIHSYREHLIIFASDDKTVDVVRVIHARANWTEFLTD